MRKKGLENFLLTGHIESKKDRKVAGHLLDELLLMDSGKEGGMHGKRDKNCKGIGGCGEP